MLDKPKNSHGGARPNSGPKPPTTDGTRILTALQLDQTAREIFAQLGGKHGMSEGARLAARIARQATEESK